MNRKHIIPMKYRCAERPRSTREFGTRAKFVGLRLCSSRDDLSRTLLSPWLFSSSYRSMFARRIPRFLAFDTLPSTIDVRQPRDLWQTDVLSSLGESQDDVHYRCLAVVDLFFSVCSFINFLSAKMKGGRNRLGKQLERTDFMFSQQHWTAAKLNIEK